MRKYHASIYMPKSALDLAFAALLRYSRHALEAAKDDRYGQIDLPKVFDSRQAELIEAKYQDDRLWRTLWRQPYSDTYDLNLVIEPDTSRVITVWLNSKDDTHDTLDEGQYATI